MATTTAATTEEEEEWSRQEGEGEGATTIGDGSRYLSRRPRQGGWRGITSPTTGRCGAGRSSSIQTTMAMTTMTEHDDDPSPSMGHPTSGRHSSRSP